MTVTLSLSKCKSALIRTELQIINNKEKRRKINMKCSQNPHIIAVLAARDRRVKIQEMLLKKFSGNTLISFKLNIPGDKKDNPSYRMIFEEGEVLLKEALELNNMSFLFSKSEHLMTGSEGYYCIDADPLEVKRITAEIEIDHPLGRLYDYDVITSEGQQIKRGEIDFPLRKCFICEEDAFVCARSRKHPLAEIVGRVEELISAYYSMLNEQIKTKD